MDRPHRMRRGTGLCLMDMLAEERYRIPIGQYLASERLGEILLISLDSHMLMFCYNYRQWLIVAHIEWRAQLLVQRAHRLGEVARRCRWRWFRRMEMGIPTFWEMRQDGQITDLGNVPWTDRPRLDEETMEYEEPWHWGHGQP